jgi:hypothetical protein
MRARKLLSNVAAALGLCFWPMRSSRAPKEPRAYISGLVWWAANRRLFLMLLGPTLEM